MRGFPIHDSEGLRLLGLPNFGDPAVKERSKAPWKPAGQDATAKALIFVQWADLEAPFY